MTTSASMRLSDLCTLVTIPVDPKDRPDAVYVGLEHVASGRLERIGKGRARDLLSAKHAFQPGDVLYGKLRPYLDKAVLAADAGVCTTELLVLRPKDGVDPRFLVSVVHAPAFVEHAVAGTTGVQHPRTSWKHIADFEIPPIRTAEQATIGSVSWAVHYAITANEKAIHAGTELKRAAMHALFTRGLRGGPQKETEIGSLPESWGLQPIGQYARQMQYGLSVRGEARGRYPILRMNCQQDGKVIFRDLQYVDIDEATAEAYRVRPGDILFNRTNSYELVGRTAIAETESEAVFASYLVRVSVDESRLNPRFLNHFLNWEVAQAALRRLATRGVGQANISAGKLRGFVIPVPDPKEQAEIVSIVDVIDQKIDLHRRKRVVLEDLIKTLLHKLMTGEILVSDLDLSALNPNGTEPALA